MDIALLFSALIGSRWLGVWRWGLEAGGTRECALGGGAQAWAERLAHDFSRREDLYRDFIVAASRAYGEAIINSEPKIQELIALYAMLSRMRVLSSPQTVACAQKVMVVTIATYSSPNKTVPELHDLLESGTVIDPREGFC